MMELEQWLRDQGPCSECALLQRASQRLEAKIEVYRVEGDQLHSEIYNCGQAKRKIKMCRHGGGYTLLQPLCKVPTPVELHEDIGSLFNSVTKQSLSPNYSKRLQDEIDEEGDLIIQECNKFINEDSTVHSTVQNQIFNFKIKRATTRRTTNPPRPPSRSSSSTAAPRSPRAATPSSSRTSATPVSSSSTTRARATASSSWITMAPTSSYTPTTSSRLGSPRSTSRPPKRETSSGRTHSTYATQIFLYLPRLHR